MADGSIHIDTKFDSSAVEKGLSKAKKSINSISTESRKTFTEMSAESGKSVEEIQRDVKELAEKYQKEYKMNIPNSYKKAYKDMGLYSEKTKEEIKDDATDMGNAHKENAEKAKGAWKKGLSAVGSLSKSAASAISKGIAVTGAALSVVSAAAATATVALTKAAVESYAEYEQLVGGVETLFGAGGQSLKEYAQSVGKTTSEVKSEYNSLLKAQEKVLENADNAYKTAGLSANEYMETVTSFSAALINSLGGDTQKAAKYADTAITDMSDNANKMGTDMELIQNTYQSLARGSFAMLDNLKLGYGGTKEEMQRLLEDAQAISGIEYDISSYADVVDAIHVIQEEMGIAGTTAKEASETISGSMNAAKAAWSNLVTGIADDNQDFGKLVDNFVESVAIAGDNILPRIEVALNGVGDLIEELLPVIMERVPSIIMGVLPGMLQTIGDIASQLITSLAGYAPEIIDLAVTVIESFVTGLQSNLPTILTGAVSIITSLANGIITILPILATIAIQIIQTLITGLLTVLPTLVPVALQIVVQLVTALISMLPQILETGIQIIIELAAGISDALPELIPTVVEVMLQLVDTLLDNIDKVLDAAIDIIMALADGLINAIPILLEKAPTIIQKVYEALVKQAPKMLTAARELVLTLGKGLISNLPLLAEKVPEIINAIVNGIKNGLSQVVSIGANIVTGLWNGISSNIDWILGKVGGFAQSIIDKAKKVLGIHSPSKEFAWVGQMCVEGFDQEFENYNPYDSLNKAMKVNKATLEMEYKAGLEHKYGAVGVMDYSKYAEANVKAMKKSGLTVTMNGRELGRLIDRRK